MHENDVDVGCVVELATTELPHPDHGEGDLTLLQGGFETSIRKVRQPGTGKHGVGDPREVTQHDPEELPPFEAPQTIEPVGLFPPAQRRGAFPHQPGPVLGGWWAIRIRDRRELLGDGQQHVSEDPAAPESLGEERQTRRVVPEGCGRIETFAKSLADAKEREQAFVGKRRVGQEPQDRRRQHLEETRSARGPADKLRQGPRGSIDVSESEDTEALA